MTRNRLFLVLGIVVLLLLLLGGILWWWLFGSPAVAAAELVPSDTVVLATIPNAATIATGYQSSHLKTLADSPQMKPLFDYVKTTIGAKGLDVLNTLLPNLSGQSFIAITHIDTDKPSNLGFIAAMKPKFGTNNFNAFVEKLKATWPDALKDTHTGTGNIDGTEYQWIAGPGSPGKICVLQMKGWIVTTWGEPAMKDWIERIQKKSSTPSLAKNPDYQKAVERVGKNPMALVYLNYHQIIGMIQPQLEKTNPAAAEMLAKKLGSIGGFAMATRFENGDIVDRFSVLMPRQAQLEAGMAAEPCPFDTLKFTGPNTVVYATSNLNWKQYWKNLEEQAKEPALNPTGIDPFGPLNTWAKTLNLDVQHNIVDALGSEISLQVEWNPDSTYPEAGLFVKLDKPDDFQPVLKTVIQMLGVVFQKTAVVRELKAPTSGQAFEELKFIQASPFIPTIAENGPYLAVFTTDNMAVRSYERDQSATLAQNADFARQVGDKRKDASQLFFIDSPKLLDRTYKTAGPYLSIAGMANKDIGNFLKNLPPDMGWLAPMGTWSLVVTADDEGTQGYSVSGIGNQEFLYAGVIGAGVFGAYQMGLIPKPNSNPAMPPTPPTVPPADDTTTPPVSGTGAAPDANTPSPDATTPPATPAPAPTPAPDSTTPPPSAPDAPTTPAPDAAPPKPN